MFVFWDYDPEIDGLAGRCIGDAEQTFTTGGKNEEGYDVTTTTYWVEDGRLMCSESRRFRDCDGPGSSHGTFVCTGIAPEADGLPRAHWERVSWRQRDVYAENAGY